MKKLHVAIVCIFLVLFISCDEKKAEDDITKAITKITDKAGDVIDAVDKTTPKPKGSGTLTNTEGEDAGGEEAESEGVEEPEDTPTLIKPVLNRENAPWSRRIVFAKIAQHTYKLKEEKTGVALTEYNRDIMQVTATQSAQNVIVVATFDGRTSESNPIEFTRVQGNTLSFAQAKRTVNPGTTASYTQTATNSGTVAGDNRNIQYSVSPTGEGVIIDSSSGEITFKREADIAGDYTITAELQQNAKYTRATATYSLTVE